MENKDLVELAIWAGFTKYNIETGWKESWRDEKGFEHEQDMRIDVWRYPDGTDSLDHVTDDNTVDRLPDFFHSFDYCLEWLVPELRKRDTNLRIELSMQWLTNEVKIYVGNPADDDFPTRLLSRAMRETPALALCGAIKRLIDREAKVGEARG